MEFPFSINTLFGEEISKVDNRVKPFRSSPDRYHQFRDQLFKVIDKIGEASAKAQGLHGSITSGRKMEFADYGHHLYVLKDEEANKGNGAILGFIKVGYKKLFVYDSGKAQHEMIPLCVLDFYVHESRQRTGCGKKLFEHVLKEEDIKPVHLAIDRPSFKFTNFLKKHYNLKSAIPQVNNFVVFEGFFKGRPERKAGSGRPPVHPYHNRQNNFSRNRHHDNVWKSDSGRQSSLSNSNVPLTQLEKEKEALKDIQVPRSNSRENMAAGLPVGSAIPSGLLDKRSNSLNLELESLTITNANRALGAGATMYCRHDMTATPPGRQKGSAQQQNRSTPTKGIIGQEYSRIESHNHSSSVQSQLTSIQNTQGAYNEPLLKRDGPPADYLGVKGALHGQNSYQTRGGHLKVTPANATSPGKNTRDPPPNDASPHNQRGPQTLATTWNVFGVPPNNNQSPAARRYQHTKLW